MDALTGIVGFVVFIFSIIVHENAHGLVAWRLGDPTAHAMGRITMNPIPHVDPVGSVLLPVAAFLTGAPFVGWAKPVPVDPNNLKHPVRDSAIVAAAGPASNLLLALVASILWITVRVVFKHVPALYVVGEQTLFFFDTLCRSMITFNCVLAVFNLLPIPPLDGHWILIHFLPEGPRQAIAGVGRFGFMILILLLWTGILWKIIGPPFRLAVSGFYLFVDNAIRLL